MNLGQIYWRLDCLRGHPDQTSPDELKTLSSIANGVTALEIGSWMGCSTIKIAQKITGKLYCVDAWQGTPADDLSWIARHRDVFNAFWRRIGKAGLQDVVIPLRGVSQDVLPVLASGTFDFIYIDGDHRYDGVKFDIEQAQRLIRPGGVIAGHDYDDGHPDVARAVREAFEKPNHEGRVWYRKAG